MTDSPAPRARIIQGQGDAARIPAARAQEYFEEAWEAAGRALVEGRDTGRCLAIAGEALRLRITGEAMARSILPGLTHHPEAEDVPGLEVRIVDAEVTGESLPEPPWSARAYLARGDVAGLEDGPVRAAGTLHAPTTSIEAVTLYHRESGRAVFWARSGARLSPQERAGPMRYLLSWWLPTRGLNLVHAAAVGRGSRALLLAGPSGSGKSTTSLLALRAGFRFAGDDYVLVRLPEDGSAPRVHCLYASAKVFRAELSRRLPDLAAWADPPHPEEDPGEKATLALAAHAPDQVALDLEVVGLLCPVVRGGPDCSLEPITAAATLRATAPSTALQLPYAGAALVGRLAELVRRLPRRRLALGEDLTRVPAALDAALEELAR